MKAYFYSFTLIVSLSLVGLSLTNYLINPYGFFHSPLDTAIAKHKPYAKQYLRITVPYKLAFNEFSALFIGSSRVGRGLNCSFVAASEDCFNAAIPSTSSYDLYRIAQQKLESGKLDALYYGLDFYSYPYQKLSMQPFDDSRLVTNQEGGLNAGFWQQFITDYFSALVSLEVTEHSVKTLGAQGKVAVNFSAGGCPLFLGREGGALTLSD
ncbi:hypothetical protein [Oceanicoccus sagamiensis]|uniref:Uncharacterized protein n=1 Tax=Oceanicoccus sagamiensis TaxID=716816 RepID=A0A1X9NA56_9GAMM|nr:hypothetical protein [Oceanicoccus sagamiensis]ARN74938.1 hypothetical protein BST96_12935 [Oceanicoccus sagamiensis]